MRRLRDMTTDPAPQVAAPPWTLADRLRKVRRDVLEISQNEFAERLGIGSKSYSAYEADRGRPRDVVALARRVQLISGVPAAWLLGVDEPTPTPPGPPRPTATSATMRRYTLRDQLGIRRPRRSGVLVPAAHAAALEVA